MKGEMLCFYSESSTLPLFRAAVPACGNRKNIFQMKLPIVLQPHLSLSCHRERLIDCMYLLPFVRSFIILRHHYHRDSVRVRVIANCTVLL